MAGNIRRPDRLVKRRQAKALPERIRIVFPAMPRGSLLRLAPFLVACATACARPVLYYPPGPAAPPAKAPPPDPVSAAAPASDKPTLMILSDATAGMSDHEYLRYRRIVVPVAGADMTRVEDSFNEPRDGDRVHHAIDILAPRGTPILSADDGRILRMSTSSAGGICMYTV